MSDSSSSWSACTISATRAARRSLSPKRISAVATLSFSLITGTQPRPSSVRQRGARVEVAAAVLGVVQRQQQLRGGQAVRGQRLGPGLRQPDLADGGGGLLLLQPQPALGEAEAAPGQGDGAGARPGSPAVPRARSGGDVGGHAVAARRRAGAASASTTSALPILTTSSRGGGQRSGVTPAASRRAAARSLSISARSSSGTPWPVDARHQHAPACPDAAPAPARRAEVSRGVIASVLFSAISSGLSASPPP